MISDDRLDQLIRSSLGWQAARAARTQPTLAEAAARLSARVGSSRPMVQPRLLLAPVSGSARLLLAVLLLSAMLVAAAVVGAYLLDRNRPDPRPGPFGFAAPCPATTMPRTELQVTLDGSPPTSLHPGGILVTDLSQPGASKQETVRLALSEERLLTPVGRNLLLEHVAGAGLTPGCRLLQTERSNGQIHALTAQGYVEATWGPTLGEFRRARPVTAAEEADLDALARELLQPGDWLPQDAWADGQPVRRAPREWLITIAMAGTDYRPGDGLNLQNGVTLPGFDPRYEQVALPGGADLATFGEELPFPPPQPPGGTLEMFVRCALLSDDAALELADSLDQLDLGADGFGDLFTTDLSLEIAIGLRPAIPAGYDCQALYDDERPDRDFIPVPVPTFAGDLAQVDPCGLVPSGEPLLKTLGVARTVEQVAFLGAAPSRSCVLFDTTDTMAETAGRYGYWRAALTLYPSTVSRADATEIARGWLGAGAVEQVIADGIVWANGCAASGLRCAGGYAAWSNGRLLGFEHAPSRGPRGRFVDQESAWSFVVNAMARLH